LDENKEDVNGCKIVKIKDHIQKYLKIHDFNLINSDFYYDKDIYGVIWFEIKKEDLSPVIEKQGPPTVKTANVKKFKKKHSCNYTRDNRLYARIKRDYLTPDTLIKDLLNSRYVTEKVKKIDLID
jgi:tRNA nucleotidyltransferase (CCA-adding enzyme)